MSSAQKQLLSRKWEEASHGMKASCTVSHSLIMGEEQESLKAGNFDSIEDNEHN